eukprot:COSAG02_NODE_10658_length_1889_cov_2448.502793_1_plen_368_part_10
MESELHRLESATESGLLAVQGHVDVLQEALGKAELALSTKLMSLQASVDSLHPGFATVAKLAEDLEDMQEKQSDLEIDTAHAQQLTSASLERTAAACASMSSRLDEVELHPGQGGCSTGQLQALWNAILSEMDERDIRITLDQQFMQAAIDEHERLLREDSDFRKETIDALESRDVELSLDHQLLQAMVEQLQSQVHSLAESNAHDITGLQQLLQHRLDAVQHRLDVEVASLHSSSLQLDTELHATMGKLQKQFEKHLAEQVAARDATMQASLELARCGHQQDIAMLTATVTQLSAELQAAMSRSIATVDARASTSSSDLSDRLEANSARLGSQIDTALTVAADSETIAREARKLSSRVAEASVGETA